MHSKTSFGLVGLVLCAGFAWGQTPATPNDVSDLQLKKEQLQSDIQRMDKDMARTDSLSRFEEQNFQEQKGRFQADIGKRRNELQALQQKLAEIHAQAQKEQAREANAKVQTENWNARLKFFTKELEKQAQTLEQLIAKSLPFQRDSRLDRVRALIRDIQAGTATETEAFGRLQSMYDEEIRFGDEIVVTEQSIVRNNGSLVNVKLLRLGNVGAVYADAEGKYFGILRRDANGKENWLEDLDFHQRDIVRRSIEVKAGKLPPELSTLPFWFVSKENHQ